MPETPDQKDILTSHNYDGIQEYDNPTPGWWTWLFIGSIAFGLIYCLLAIAFTTEVEGEDMPYFGTRATFNRLQTAAIMERFGELEGMQPDAETLSLFVNDPENGKWLNAGQAVFTANCAACHGAGGAGLSGSGSNLTDEHYKHVRQVTDIVDVIRKGRANGAMPAWDSRLNDPQVLVVSAFVASLRGTNAAGGIQPEADAQVTPPFFE